MSPDAVLRELAALAASSWPGAETGPRSLSRRLASLLHAALRPALVHIALDDAETGESAIAIDGKDGADAGFSLEQWRALLGPVLKRDARERIHVVPHPTRAGKLKLLVVRVESGAGGYIAIASSDPAFPSERDELLVQVAGYQAATALDNGRAQRGLDSAGPGGGSTLQQIAQLVTEIDDGVEVLDRDWRITYLNEKAAAIFGRPRTELVGISLWDLLPNTIGNNM